MRLYLFTAFRRRRGTWHSSRRHGIAQDKTSPSPLLLDSLRPIACPQLSVTHFAGSASCLPQHMYRRICYVSFLVPENRCTLIPVYLVRRRLNTVYLVRLSRPSIPTGFFSLRVNSCVASPTTAVDYTLPALHCRQIGQTTYPIVAYYHLLRIIRSTSATSTTVIFDTVINTAVV